MPETVLGHVSSPFHPRRSGSAFAVLDGTIIGPQDSIVAFFAVVVGVGCVWLVLLGVVWVFSTRRCLVGFLGVCGVFGGGGFAWVWWVVYVVLLLPLAGRPSSGGVVLRVCGGGLRTQERVCTTSFIVNDCQSGPRFRAGCLIVLRGSPRGRLMGVGVFVRVAFPY